MISVKQTILFVAPGKNSFITSDRNILAKEFNIIENIYRWNKKLLTPVHILRQILFFAKTIKRSHSIVIEFAGYWSLIPVLYGRFFNVNTFIILHGTESANLPELNYGSLRKFPLRWFCMKSAKFADMLLPVSDSLIKTRNTFLGNKDTEMQGLYHFFPNLTTPYKVIHNGLDSIFWTPDDITKDQNSFITVFGPGQFFLKGGDLLIDLAKRRHDLKIYVAGFPPENIGRNIPENIMFFGHVEQSELKTIFSRCKFYFQLSAFEGFGLSLCEAMLCKCIPIGSNVNAIPDIIGDTGYIVSERNIDELEKIVLKAIDSKTGLNNGEAARSRIIEKFPLSHRKNKLINILNEL